MDQFARIGTDGMASHGDSDIQYKIIFETVLDGLEVIDAETGRIVLANQAAATMFGFGSPEEMVGLDPLDYIPTEDRQLVACRIAEHMFEKNLHEVMELRCATKDGRLVWLSAIGVRTEYQGKPAGLISMRDITKQKLAEEQLRRSEAENRLLIENADQGIVVVQDGAMRFVNPYVTAVSGYSREELISKPFVEFIHPDDREMVAGQYIRRVEGKETLSAYQFRFITKDGNARWGETNVIHYTWDGRPAVLAFLADITGRKQTEEQEYKTIISSAMDGFCVADTQGMLLDVNDACCNLLGYRREELMNMHIWDIEAMETAAEPGQRIRKIMQVGKDRFETRLRRKDGQIIDVEASVNYVDIKGGRLFIFLRDITERKKAEGDLKVSEERFRAVFEKSPIGIAVYDGMGVPVAWNKACLDIFGLPPDAREAGTPPLFEDPNVMDKARQALRMGKTLTWEGPLDLDKAREAGVYHATKSGTIHLRGMMVGLSSQKEKDHTGYIALLDDITERKNAEEALTESEERFKILFEHAPECYYLNDIQGRILAVNRAAEELTGYTRDEAIGKSFLELGLISSEQIEEAVAILQAATLTLDSAQRPVASELVLRCKEGRQITAEIRTLPVKIKGQYVMLGIARDITERKRMEEQLQRQERYFRAITERSSDVVVVVGKEGIARYVSPTVEHMLGITREQAEGAGFMNSVHPDDIPKVAEDWAYLMEHPGGTAKGERRLQHADGSWRYVEAIGYSLLHDPAVEGVVINIRDITERKKSQQELEQSETRYRLLAENLSDIIWTMGTDLKYTYISPSVTHLRGYTVEEAMAQPLAENLTPASLETAMKLMVEEEAKERTGQYDPNRSVTMEVELSCKNGSTMWAENTVTYLRDSNGQITAYLGVSRDITERKKAEARQQQAQAQLALSSRLASIGQLASGVAHEINNPLSVVIGCSQMLMEKDVPEGIKEDLQAINDSAERVAGVVKGLLAFGRQRQPGKEYVDVNALVSRVLGLRAHEMSIHNIKVTTRLDPDLSCTMADVGQMQQVFLNIILNAEQAMTKANKDGHLLVKTGQTGDRITITFRDDGIGIPKEYLPRLFDPFFSTKDVGEGMGLGLSISYGIIKEHNGRIYAKGQPGKGATFVVELPIVAKPDQPESAEKPAEEPREKVIGRILVVDDEPAICQLLKDLLTRDGHSVETIGDASVALERVKCERFSLILLDIRMKGMNGIDLYQQMGKIAESLQRRVIFITGDTLARDTRDFLDGAAAPHICKPFDIQQLRKMINQVLWSEG